MDVKTVVVAAVEDDRVVLASAKFAWANDRYEASELSPIQTLPRQTPGDDSLEDDQGNIASERIFEHIRSYAESIGSGVDVFCLSTFGNVDLKSGVVTHVPNRGGSGEPTRRDFPDYIDRESVG